MEQAATSLPKSFPWLSLIKTAGGLLGSLILAYGATQFALGQNNNRLNTLEKQQEQMVSREEFKVYMDSTREDLREIKQNVRDIRSELRDRR